METTSEDAVAAALEKTITFDVPSALRISIARQSRGLMSLATSLLQSGMDEQQVRTVLDRVCASYRDELISAILALRKSHESQPEAERRRGAPGGP